MDAAVYVYRVAVAGEMRDYVSVLPPERAQAMGLPNESIVGVLLRRGDDGEPVLESFSANPAFQALLNEVVGRHAPDEPAVREQAERVGSGYVYVIDGRTPDPRGDVPAEDVVGAFQVRDGQVVREPYLPNPKHQLLTADGFIRLSDTLNQHLLDEIARRRGDA